MRKNWEKIFAGMNVPNPKPKGGWGYQLPPRTPCVVFPRSFVVFVAPAVCPVKPSEGCRLIVCRPKHETSRRAKEKPPTVAEGCNRYGSKFTFSLLSQRVLSHASWGRDYPAIRRRYCSRLSAHTSDVQDVPPVYAATPRRWQ